MRFLIRRDAIPATGANKVSRLPAFNLSLKLSLCLIGGLLLIFSALGYKIIRLHREDLEEATRAAGDRITDMVKRSTRFGMMHNRRDETHEIISSVGTQPGIEKISIYNKAGEIKFSTNEQEISTRVDKSAEACHVCHVREGQLAGTTTDIPHKLTPDERTRIFVDNASHRTLSVINPIENEPSCSTAACHAHSPEVKVLGMINVRMSLDSVDQAITQSRRQMVFNLVIAIAVLSIVFAALIWQMVHKPVRRLIVGTNRVAAGDLDYKLSIVSGDEVGELAGSFNRMTDELKRAHAEISRWARTLEDRVEKKTAELQQANEQVVRIERLASLGKLAAIVAHEINNPLAGILVYAKLLLKRLDRSGASKETEQTRSYLETIASESARCGEIVKDLLQFARQGKPNPEPSDINDIIRQSVRLLQHKFDLMNVRTKLMLDETLEPVACDGQQIKQALVALLINACEAIHSSEGIITIISTDLPERDAVQIRVNDNGSGMDEDTKRRLFEPFFSTKESGKGVGLGLAVVYGIVTSHGGEIEVESAPGCGSTFIIHLLRRPATLVDGVEPRQKLGVHLSPVSVSERP